jgi:hypothetical protein
MNSQNIAYRMGFIHASRGEWLNDSIVMLYTLYKQTRLERIFHI